MIIKVTDFPANPNENLRHVVNVIGKSQQRRKVFEAIYKGKQQVKTVEEIAKATGLSEVRVLQEAGKLAANHIVEKTKKNKKTAYKKDETYSHHKSKILRILDNPEKVSKFPTKQSPASSVVVHRIVIKDRRAKAIPVTVDDIYSFRKIKSIGGIDASIRLDTFPESKIKSGLKKIIGETHEFKDWGGEKNDLYTNKLIYKNIK